VAGPDRFTILAALRVAGSAVARRPWTLAAIVVVNMATTAALAAGEAVWLPQQDGAMWIALRLGLTALYGVNDATIGLLAVTVALEGLAGERPPPAATIGRTLRAFAPAMVVSTLACLPAMAGSLTSLLPGEAEAAWDGWIDLTSFLATILVACTIGLAPFAAVAGWTGLWAAVKRSLLLSRLARWRLAWLGVLHTPLGDFSSNLGWTLAAVIGGSGMVQEQISQAVFTVWYMATVIVSVGVGTVLSRVAQGRNPDEIADQFD
jgi:hypothetical protein